MALRDRLRKASSERSRYSKREDRPAREYDENTGQVEEGTEGEPSYSSSGKSSPYYQEEQEQEKESTDTGTPSMSSSGRSSPYYQREAEEGTSTTESPEGPSQPQGPQEPRAPQGPQERTSTGADKLRERMGKQVQNFVAPDRTAPQTQDVTHLTPESTLPWESRKDHLSEYFSDEPFSVPIDPTDPSASVTREARAQNQSASEAWGSGITKFVGKTGTAVLGGTVGTVYGALKGLGTLVTEGSGSKALKAFYDNEIFHATQNANEWMNEALPNYKTKREREAGFFNSLGSADFWADDVFSGVSFVAGAIISELLTAGVATAVLPARAGAKMSKMARAARLAKAKKSEKAYSALEKGLKVGTFGRKMLTGAGYESAVETNHYRDQLEQRLIKNFQENNGREPDEEELAEIRSKANQHANKVFAGNFALVGSSNAVMLPSIFGMGWGSTSRRALGMLRRTEDGMEVVGKRAQGKMAQLGEIGKRASYEGFVEEGGQSVISEGFMNYTTRSSDPDAEEGANDLMSSFHDAFENTFTGAQGSKEIGIGFMIGALGGAAHKKNHGDPGEGKIGFGPGQEERKMAYDEATRIANEFNATPESFMEAQREQYDAVKEFSALQKDKEQAIINDDPFLFKNAENDQTFSYFRARHKAGLLDEEIKRLKELKEVPNENIAEELGLDPEEVTDDRKKEMVDEAINRAERVRESENNAQRIAPDMDENTRKQLSHLYYSIGDIDHRIDEISKDLNKKTNGAVNWKSIEKKYQKHDPNRDPEEHRKELLQEVENFAKSATTNENLKKYVEQSKVLQSLVKEVNTVMNDIRKNKKAAKADILHPGRDAKETLEILDKYISSEKKKLRKDLGLKEEDKAEAQRNLNKLSRLKEAINNMATAPDPDLAPDQINEASEMIKDLTRLQSRREAFMDHVNAITQHREDMQEAQRKMKEEAEEKKEKEAEEKRSMDDETAEPYTIKDRSELNKGDVIEYDGGLWRYQGTFAPKTKGASNQIVLKRGQKKREVAEEAFDRSVDNEKVQKRPNKYDAQLMEVLTDPDATSKDIMNKMDELEKESGKKRSTIFTKDVKELANEIYNDKKRREERSQKRREERSQQQDQDTKQDTGTKEAPPEEEPSQGDINNIEGSREDGKEGNDPINPDQDTDEDPTGLEQIGEGTPIDDIGEEQGPQETTGQPNMTGNSDQSIMNSKGNYSHAVKDPQTSEIRRRDEGEPADGPALKVGLMVSESKGGGLSIDRTKIDQDAQGNSIIVKPGLMADPNMDNNSELEVEVVENQYWNERKEKLNEDEHWKEIPMYIKYNGEYINTLQSGDSEIRRKIYQEHQQGNRVVLSLNRKIFDATTNLNNIYDESGNRVLRPLSDLMSEGIYQRFDEGRIGTTDSVNDAILSIIDIEQWDRNYYFGSGVSNRADVTRLENDLQNAYKHAPGTVKLIITDPQGNYKDVNLSTSDLSQEAIDIAIDNFRKAFSNESNNAQAQEAIEDLADIVANSKEFRPLANEYLSGYTDFSYKDPSAADATHVTNSINKFFNIGKGSIIYMSPGAGHLIEMTKTQIQKALNGEQFSYNRIDGMELGEQGVDINEKTTLNADFDLVEDLKEFMSTKKYHVDKERINDRNPDQPFRSPITGREYENYIQYLSSPVETVKSSEDSSLSSPAILRTDLISDNGSVFFDIGLTLSNPKASQTSEERTEEKLDNTPGTNDNVDEGSSAGPEGYTEYDSFDYERPGEDPQDNNGRIKDARIDQQAAKEWFDKRLGDTVDLSFFEAKKRSQRIGNMLQHGYFRDNAVYLWDQADVGTEYHEAFHAVFHMFLDESERSQVLNDGAKRYKKSRKKDGDLSIEEDLAEDFRDYAMGTQEMSLPKRIAEFFKSLYSFIKYMVTRTMTSRDLHRMIQFNTMPHSFKRRGREARTSDINRDSLKPDIGDVQQKQTVDTLTQDVVDTYESLREEGYQNMSFDEVTEKVRESLFKNAFSYKEDGSEISWDTARELKNALDQEGKDGLKEIMQSEGISNSVPYSYISDGLRKQFEQQGLDIEERRTKMAGTMIKGVAHQDRWYDQKDDEVTENIIEKGWKSLVREELSNYNFRVRRDRTLEEDLEQDMDIQKIYDRAHMEEDPSKKVSADIRLFMSRIPEGTYNHLGRQIYVPFDRMYIETVFATADTLSYRQMLERIKEMSKTKPEFQTVLERLQNSSEDFIARFYHNMRTSSNNFMVLKQDVNRKGKGDDAVDINQVRIYFSNKNSMDSLLRENWNANMIEKPGHPNKDHLIRENEDGSTALNQQKAEGIINDYNEIIKYIKDPSKNSVNRDTIKRLQRVLDGFGIEFTEEQLSEYITEGETIKRKGGRYENLHGLDLLRNMVEGGSKGRGITNLVKVIADFDKKKEVTDVKLKEEPQDPFRAEESTINKLIGIKKRYSDEIMGSFVNSMGKMIYPINLPSRMSDVFNRISQGEFFYKEEDGRTLLRKEYANDPRMVPVEPQSESVTYRRYDDPVLKDLRKQGEESMIRRAIEVREFEAFKERYEERATEDYENLDRGDSWKVRLNAFLKSGDSTYTMINQPIMGGRTRLPFITLPRVEKFAEKYSTRGATRGFREILTGLMIGEISKIQKAREDQKNYPFDELIEGFHYGINKNGDPDTSLAQATQFNQLPIDDVDIPTNTGVQKSSIKLSEIDLKAYADQDADAMRESDVELERDPDDVSMEEDGKIKTVNDAIKSQLNNISEQIKDYRENAFKELKRSGIIKTNKNGEIVDDNNNPIDETGSLEGLGTALSTELDQSSMRSLFADKDLTTKQALKSMLDSYAMNWMFWKNELIKIAHTGQEFSKNYEDLLKRNETFSTPMAKFLEQGEIEGAEGYGMPSTFNDATIRDLMSSKKANKEAQGLSNSIMKEAEIERSKGNEKEAEKLQEISDEIEKSYKEGSTNKTDAQSFISLTMYRNMARGGMTDWTVSHEEAYQNYLSDGTFKDNDGKRPELHVLKPVYHGHNEYMGWAVNDMIKTSFMPLIKEFTEHYKIFDDLRQRMEATGEYKNMEPIDVVSLESSRKQAIIGAKNIGDGSIESIKDLRPRALKTEGLGIPQAIADKSSKDPIYSIQLRKNVLTNIARDRSYILNQDRSDETSLTGEQVFQLYNELGSDLIDKSLNKLEEDLGIKRLREARKKGNTFEIETAKLNYLKNLKRMILDQVEEKELPDNYEKALTIIETDEAHKEGWDFLIPLAFPVYQRNFENILLSKFKRDVFTQRISGTDAAQIAELGGHSKFLKGDNKENYEDTRGRELAFITTEGERTTEADISNISHAEVVVSESVLDKLNIKPGDIERIDQLPEDLRTIIGYRTPNQGKGSALPMKIVDVMPDNYKGAIMVPGEITTQQGSDFDIDKLFIMSYNYDIEGLIPKVKEDLQNSDINDLSEEGEDLTKITEMDMNFIDERKKNPYDFNEEPDWTPKQKKIADSVRDFFENNDVSTKNIKKKSFDYSKAFDKNGEISQQGIQGQDREQVENAIIDLTESILRHPAHLAEVARPLESTEFEDMVEEYNPKEPLDPHDPATDITTQLRNTSGAFAVGTYANIQSGQAIASHGDLTFSRPIKYQAKGEKAHQEYDSLSKNRDREGEYIYYNIAKHLSAAVDNPKDPLMAMLNDNSITAPVTNLMLSSGLTTKDAHLFRLQPMIKEFVDRRERLTFEDDRQIVSQMIHEYGSDSFKKRSAHLKGQSMGTKPMTEEELDQGARKSLDDMSGDQQQIDRQLELLENFHVFQMQGRVLQRVYKALTPDTIKNLSSYAAIQEEIDKARHAAREQDQIMGVVRTLKRNKMMERYSKLVMGDIFSYTDEHFSYGKPSISTVKKDLAHLTDNRYITERAHNKINNMIFTSIFSRPDSPLHYMFTESNVRRIIRTKDENGNKNYGNIRNRLKDLKEKYPKLARNQFISRLQIPIRENTSELASLRFDSKHDYSKFQVDMFSGAIKDLYENPKGFANDPNNEDQSNEIQQFAEDLITYSILNNGFAPALESFTNFIPVEIWANKKNQDGENVNQFYRRIEGEMEDPNMLTDIELDIIRHMYEEDGFLTKIPQDQVQVSGNNPSKKSFPITNYNIQARRSREEEQATIPFFRVKNSKSKTHDIYIKTGESDGQVHYQKLQPLGEPGKLLEIGIREDQGAPLLESIDPENRKRGSVEINTENVQSGQRFTPQEAQEQQETQQEVSDKAQDLSQNMMKVDQDKINKKKDNC